MKANPVVGSKAVLWEYRTRLIASICGCLRHYLAASRVTGWLYWATLCATGLWIFEIDVLCVCDSWVSHGGDYERHCFLGRDVV